MLTEAADLRRRADDLRVFLRSLPDNGGEEAMPAWRAVVAMDDAANSLERLSA